MEGMEMRLGSSRCWEKQYCFLVSALSLQVFKSFRTPSCSPPLIQDSILMFDAHQLDKQGKWKKNKEMEKPRNWCITQAFNQVG
eukprot:646674-Pelagomonas_calceolata.AAC.5